MSKRCVCYGGGGGDERKAKYAERTAVIGRVDEESKEIG